MTWTTNNTTSTKTKHARRGGGWGILLALWLFGTHNALADNNIRTHSARAQESQKLYRCTGVMGEPVFSNRPVGYHDCKEVTRYKGTLAAPQPSGMKPEAIPVGGSVRPASSSRRGAMYRMDRPDGSVEYTNVPRAAGRGRAGGAQGGTITMLFTYIPTCMACNLTSPIRWDSVALDLASYAETIRAAGATYGVDEAFLRAVIQAESAFDPHALSAKGAQGLMQLMPGTANAMGVHNAFDTVQNIQGGARYLGLMLRTFDGNEALAAAAYNAGPAAVNRYNGVPPYAETRVYVARVRALRQRYGAALGGSSRDSTRSAAGK